MRPRPRRSSPTDAHRTAVLHLSRSRRLRRAGRRIRRPALSRPARRCTERRARMTALAAQGQRPSGTSASIRGVLTGDRRGRQRLLRSALYQLLGAPWPLVSAVEPARTKQPVALDLPPRTQLLQSSGPSQLVDLAQDRLHFLVVACREHPVDCAHSTSRRGSSIRTRNRGKSTHAARHVPAETSMFSLTGHRVIDAHWRAADRPPAPRRRCRHRRAARAFCRVDAPEITLTSAGSG